MLHLLSLFVAIVLCPWATHYTRLLLFETLMPARFSMRRIRLLYPLCLGTSQALLSFVIPDQYRVLLILATYLADTMILFRGRLAIRLLCFALWMALFSGCEALYMVLALAAGWNYSNMNWLETFRANVMIAAFAVLFSLLLRSTAQLVADRLDKKLWRRLALSALCSTGASVIITFNLFLHGGAGLNTWMSSLLPAFNAVGLFLPLVGLTGLLMLVYRLNASLADLQEAHFAKDRAQQELHQNQLAMQKSEQHRQLTHDMKNHLLALDMLAQQGEYARQHEYLSDLRAAFESTSPRLSCGHPLIDSLLAAKRARMEAAGIEADFSQLAICAPIALRDLELCALLGNTLDNAIEACEQLPAGEKRAVSLKLQSNARGFFLSIRNTCKDANAAAQLACGHRSPRGKGHGFGLRSVRRIADEASGELIVRAVSRTMMEVSVYLPRAKDDEAGGAKR